MEGIVMVLVIGGITFAVITVFIRQGNKRRREALQALAGAHGWQWVDRDDSLASVWPGPPFRGNLRRSRVRNAVSGVYQGRSFTAFEYAYTTGSASSQSTSTQYYCVWAVSLPAALPPISLGAEGVLGGRIARAFGSGGMEIGDPDFDRRYKVKCEYPEYGTRLLHTAMVQLLMSTDIWAWRIDGNVMLSYHKGRLTADAVVPRLDAMSRVLDNVPRHVWSQYGQPVG